MDVGTRGALVKACLCFGFLFGLLQWRVKMGFKARLEAMQNHHSAAQKRKRQRFLISKIGLLSLCSPEGLTSHTPDGCRSSLEGSFYTQKESLTRFASSSPALHRTSLFSKAKVSSSKCKFTQNEASVYDPLRLAHPGSHAHDAHSSWMDTEGSHSNDAHPQDSGWHLVSRRHSLKTGVAGTAHTLPSPVYPSESGATAADAGAAHQLLSLRHPPGFSCESAAAAADALRMLQPSVAGMTHTLHPTVSPCEAVTTAADKSHKLMALRHLPGSPCKSAAVAAADALVSLDDTTTPAVAVDVTADARVSPCELASSLVSPHEPCARMETLSAAGAPPYQVGQTLSIMARTGCAPVTASSLLGLPGSIQEGEMPHYKQLLLRRANQDNVLKDLESKVAAAKSLLEALKSTKKDVFSIKRRDAFVKEEIPTSAAFTPLSKEEEEEVQEALNGANRHQVLVQHEPSNIDLSRAALQCLKPGTWLNDEVINLYMELLKERERREQKDYLKCHFFNTFFFNKLYKDAHSYDYKAVRRWTTQRKLGYSLLECDKIFVPIHKDIHWCLAVINIREKRLQYLDSLKGNDGNALQVLARYIKDEAKDKGAEDIDVSSWDLDCPKDIPEQMNGCDCGMFMIKYADFLSRGNELKFTQEHMEYFRKRTALELLQLKAR